MVHRFNRNHLISKGANEMKPASRRKRANTTIGTIRGYIEICPGESPYLWIGQKRNEAKQNYDGFECAGVVQDQDVKKLRDMCNEILERRKIEGTTK
jgi:hypothetical protein